MITLLLTNKAKSGCYNYRQQAQKESFTMCFIFVYRLER